MDVNLKVRIQRSVDTTFKLSTNAVLEVFDNQLSNAKRFAKNSVQVTLTLTLNQLDIQVQNDGPQLSSVELANARMPFFSQQKPTHHLGVGMYICKVICQTHGGTFNIHNIPTGVATVASFNLE